MLYDNIEDTVYYITLYNTLIQCVIPMLCEFVI